MTGRTIRSGDSDGEGAKATVPEAPTKLMVRKADGRAFAFGVRNPAQLGMRPFQFTTF